MQFTAFKPARKIALGAATVAAAAGAVALPATAANAAAKPAEQAKTVSAHDNHVAHQNHQNHNSHQAHLAHLAHLNHLNHIKHLAAQNHQAASAHAAHQAHLSHAKGGSTGGGGAKVQTRTASVSTTATVSGSPQAIARQLVPANQFAAFSNIISHESGWNVHATNASSGAYGLGQALPGSKMASAGSDWRDSAQTQIKWALDYMNSRYGSPNGAWAFWQAHNWY